MKKLSKSKLLAYRQCPKRLWLEVHGPKPEVSASAQARFDEGNAAGKLARELYDPTGCGTTLNPHADGWAQALERTRMLLNGRQPIFEASFSIDGALALADVMLPVQIGKRKAWRMVEVKSSTETKDYHRDDVAIQAHVVKASGIALTSVALAHIDSSWVYPGNGDYSGIFVEADLTKEAFARGEEVQSWIVEAQTVVRRRKAPNVAIGPQCRKPFECGFFSLCSQEQPQAEYPVQWLPRVQTKALLEHLRQPEVSDLRDVPDDLLNPTQLRVKRHTLSGEVFFDPQGALAMLRDQQAHRPPAYFLDFETIKFVAPIWAGTRPYQQIPFQFSCHHLSARGKLSHHEFLDLSGSDPSLALARELIDACGTAAPVFAYNAGFEKGCIRELAARFPRLKRDLLAIVERIVDLLPVAQQHYYHPDQQGSWSIKKVLPAVVPELRYDDLDGVKDGGQAAMAYTEAINSGTDAQRKAQIDQELRIYCGLDTYAMVRLWQVFAGRTELKV